MGRKVFSITYSVQDSDYSIQEKIKSLGDWFNYFPNSWLIFSHLSSEEISNRINTNKPGDRFLVLEVELNSYWGWLPQSAWDWLNDKQTQQNFRP